jgi:hypothetical protein
MAFDAEAARAAGYSDAEIATHLATSAKFNADAARKAGYSDAEIVAHLTGAPKAMPAPDKPMAVRAGETIRDIPRQLGLTARYAIEGGGALPAMVADVPGRLYNLAATSVDSLAGTKLPRAPMAMDALPALADRLGLPQPRDANERVVGDITRTMAGAGGVAAMASKAPGAIASMLAANPGQQVAAAAGAGGAGGSVREAGGGPVEQAIASLLGGVAAGVAVPMVAGKAQSTVDAMRSRIAPPSPAQVDLQIELALSRQGINYRALADDVRRSLRAEVSDALKTGGDLRPEVLARLADYRTVGATPTRGNITLDPVQITRERNLAKTGANSTDVGMQRLAGVQNTNNRTLIDSLNRQGAGTRTDSIGAGEQVIGTLSNRLAAEKAGVDSLYSAARDSKGRSFPLDGAAMTQRVDQLLGDALVGAKLPKDVRDAVNRIAKGEMPFTVDVAEQLKTRIGDLGRGEADGNVRKALGLVRQAIDETPVLPLGQQAGPVGAARNVNPGNLPAVTNSPQLGDSAVAAFNQARAANRTMMQRIESVPALKAVYEGVEPDKFVATYITGQGKEATVSGVQALRQAIDGDQSAIDAIRGQIAAHLKSKALNGAADEVGNFSASNYDNALRAIGDRKLALFFQPDEIAQLKAVGRVARYENVQPRGSAVNNSNTGAMLAGRGLDLLDSIAGRLPIGQDTVRGFVRGMQQSQALDTRGLLAMQRDQPSVRGLLTGPQATPYLTGGLLALPAIPPRQDNRRP